MRSRFVLTSAAVLTTVIACTPQSYWKGPVGVSDKAEAAPDESLDTDDGGSGMACAQHPRLLEGKPCAPEGASCGGSGTDMLICRDGAWDRQEGPAMPAGSAKPASSSSSSSPQKP